MSGCGLKHPFETHTIPTRHKSASVELGGGLIEIVSLRHHLHVFVFCCCTNERFYLRRHVIVGVHHCAAKPSRPDLRAKAPNLLVTGSLAAEKQPAGRSHRCRERERKRDAGRKSTKDGFIRWYLRFCGKTTTMKMMLLTVLRRVDMTGV